MGSVCNAVPAMLLDLWASFDALNFSIGCIVGAAVVGASVWRTLAVYDGSIAGAAYSGAINSAAYYYSVSYIAKDNLTAYIGTAVGSTLIIMFMAYRKKLKQGG